MTLKFVIRNLSKRPLLNLIKILGLSLALSGLFLIVLFLKSELTYDRFHKSSERIYRLTVTNPEFFGGKHFARIANPEYIPQMAEYFPDIQNYVRLVPMMGGVIKHDERFIGIKQAFQCDSTFFNVFDAELLVGNPREILGQPGSMVVSDSFSKKVFGDRNPIGQILTLPEGQYYGKNTDFIVKGIMKDFPQNSHFHPELIASPEDKGEFNRWAWTYLLLSNKANKEEISGRFKDFLAMYSEKKVEEINTVAHLQNISDIHLYSHKLREIEENSDMSVVYIFLMAALILLTIALINYANLNLGMADFTDKYMFVSKMSGSSNWMQLKYFLYEGIIITLTSVVIGGFVVFLGHMIIYENFSLNLFQGNLVLAFIILVLFGLLVILSGILPLLKQALSSIHEPIAFNRKSKLDRKGMSKSLLVLQYTISIILIMTVMAIYRQTNFALSRSIGTEGNIICIENVHSEIQSKFKVFKEELLKYNSIESVSAMMEPPGGEANDMFEFTMEGYVKNESNSDFDRIGVFPCDYSFADIFSLNFLSGRNFSENNVDIEGSGEYIINESAMRRLYHINPDEIVGKDFGLIFGDQIKIPKGKIVGVVEDFHLSSLKKKVEPLVLFKRQDQWLLNLAISFSKDNQIVALSDIETVWMKMFPGHSFQYEHIESMFKKVYKTELLQSKLLSVFTLISLFICSMGLLGMSLLTTQRRTKEIGVRKVNGGKVIEILIMLNKDFVKWVIIAFVIASPIAWYTMDKWLENFAYKTELSWWIFVLSGVLALGIALLTVSWQSWRAATRNPVESLRYE